MANFEFDPRGLPQGFDKTRYYKTVKEQLVGNYDVDSNDETTIAAVVGILLNGEYFDVGSPAFDGALRQARRDAAASFARFAPTASARRFVRRTRQGIEILLERRGASGVKTSRARSD